MIIFDPGIDVTYDVFLRGKDADGYIHWPNGTDPTLILYNDQYNSTNGTDILLARAWPPNHISYPDFLSEKSRNWWANEAKMFHDRLNFDGLWIDLNEPSSFGTNDLSYNGLRCPNGQLDDPPYATWAAYFFNARLSEKTACMIADQHGFQHYNVHSLYGWSNALAAHEAAMLIYPGKRVPILSRSTFVGSGQWTAHWLGDNFATWDDLRTSIIGISEFNMFGFPLVGADICGFNFNSNAELCLRWQQMGAFYPFSRNHNAKGNIDQDPAVWGPEVANGSREALELRYRLLPFLYTLFYRAQTKAELVVRPLAFEFPDDPAAKSVDKQFLWGHDLLITPVLEPGVSEVTGYLPIGNWFSLRNSPDYGQMFTGPGWATFQAPNTTMIPILAREGRIIPAQAPALSTFYSRQ